jgi:hypothetical protein
MFDAPLVGHPPGRVGSGHPGPGIGGEQVKYL